MEWNHLPEPGGIYQQHPQLLDDWLYIWQVRHDEEDRKDRQRKAEMDQQTRRNRRLR